MPYQGKGFESKLSNTFRPAQPSRAWFAHVFNKCRMSLKH